MLMYIEGNMFESPAQVLVNTVNTVGVMGKGIALTFKKVYPDMYKNYRYYCENKQLEIGKLYLYKTPGKWILNFPTKINWRNPSKIEYIEQGLKKFVVSYKEKGIKSIAFPKLGCGNGGLDFETQVKPLMDKYLSNLDIDVYVYLQDVNKELEYMNISEMKKWLNLNIDNISITELEQDILLHSTGIADVEIFDEYIQINDQVIDYIDLLSFWEYVRDNNITIKSDVLSKYFSHLSNDNLNKFVLILSKIEYINMNCKDVNGLQLLIYQPCRRIEGLYL